MPVASEIGPYDWIPCNHSFRCLCWQCSWEKYNYHGQKPTLAERQECLKKLTRRFPLTKDETAEKKKRNARKTELKQIKKHGVPKIKSVGVQTAEIPTQTECVCLFL